VRERLRNRPWFVLLAILVALGGGSYAAKRLLESGASTIYCPRNAAGWRGHITGAKIPPSQPARERRIAKLVNQFRRQHGRHALKYSRVLATAARAHSADMIARNYFSHDTPRGRTFTQRLARYTPATCIAENIAWGTGKFGTAPSVVNDWKHSPDHRRVMLLPWTKRIGVGVQTGPFSGQQRAQLATADFAG
jgi:uncharacterized protein YkwD